MENKIFIILILIFIIGSSIIGIIGYHNGNFLKEKYPKIDSLEEVKIFLEDCNNKLFMDCDKILVRKLELNE